MEKEWTLEMMLAEDDRRHNEIFKEYDPITGVGCYDFDNRVLVRIGDIKFSEMYVPKICFGYPMFRDVARCQSVERYITKILKKKVTDNLLSFVEKELYRIRMKEDPEFAIYLTDQIYHKRLGHLVRFKLNNPQRKLLALFEDMRKKGVPIRVVILKARQWGGSTLTQLYMKWIQDFRHPEGWNSVILAQTNGTSNRIKAMYATAVRKQPGWTIGHDGEALDFTPFERSNSDFQVSNQKGAVRSSTISIASFNNFEALRGANFHMAHYSETAMWKKTPEHDPEDVVSAVSSGITEDAENMEVFESTGKGMAGFFYDKCQDAMNPENNSNYAFLFIAFFEIENDQTPVENRVEFAKWLFENRYSNECPKGYRESGKFFWRLWEIGASFDAINWYRERRNSYTAHGYMATEAPIDPIDAFKNSGKMVFDQYSIDEMQKTFKREPLYTKNIVLPKVTKKNSQLYKNATFKIAEDGCLKIWEEPNNKVLQITNRYIVCVDIGGKSDTSDYSVMTVLDRKGLLLNGVPRVVARWRGHLRHDRLAWVAAALAYYYDNALLVIESNTADRNRDSNTEGDHFGTIIEEIADYYPNLYESKRSSEEVSDEKTQKWGFQTNVLTKGWVVDTLIACVDDALWDEPDSQCYAELRIYERKEDGRTGNIEGKNNHDDIVMSTGIALWVCFNDMERPAWKELKRREKPREGKSEATI